MAPAKRRRRLPTLVNRGLGLIEVILPRGGSESLASPLPEGRRDDAGFWYPAGYDQPGDIFTPQQRRLQAKQRAIQKTRRRPGTDRAGTPRGTGGTTVGTGRTTVGTGGIASGTGTGGVATGTGGEAGGSAGGGGKKSSRNPAGTILAATTGLLPTTPDLPAIAAIVTGDFGLREVTVPMPTARLESDAVAAARGSAGSNGGGAKTVAAAGGRRVDSIIPSE